MANYDTMRSRLSEHLSTLNEAELAVFDPEAPEVGRTEAIPPAFNDHIDMDDRQRQDTNLKLSIFRGGPPEDRVYGWTAQNMVTRKSGDALKIRLATAGNGVMETLSAEEFEQRYQD